jgi:hypothetical protein
LQLVRGPVRNGSRGRPFNGIVSCQLIDVANSSDLHEGGCACGEIRYRARGDPVAALVCHCTYCQRRTGSAFAITIYFDEANVEVVSGSVAIHEHRSDESGRWLRTQFCSNCGTTIGHTAEMRPGQRAIAGGTFDDPTWFKIRQHIWVDSKVPWVSIPAEFKPKAPDGTS